MSHYPKWKYHPGKEACVVAHADAEALLGPGWHESPAEFGIETCPASSGPDSVIAEKRAKHLESKSLASKPKAQRPLKEMKS